MIKTTTNLTAQERNAFEPEQALSQTVNAERWHRAVNAARQAAQFLRENFGATRIVAFGSVAHREWFNLWSDIDLAVWGIAPQNFYRAAAAVAGLSRDFRIQTVDPNDCRSDVRQSIERHGLEL